MMKTATDRAIDKLKELYGEEAEYMLKYSDVLRPLKYDFLSEEKALSDVLEFAKRFHERHLCPANAEVGGGATIKMYSDAEACTIIKKTRCTLVVQEDTATLSPDFQPEFIPGGFCAQCINQNEQSYTYERNPQGSTERFYWSEKKGCYQNASGCRLTKGRHKFYDYNF